MNKNGLHKLDSDNMTDAEIVAALRGEGGEGAHEQALGELFPGNRGAILYVSMPDRDIQLATAQIDASRIFTALLRSCIHIGQAMGIQLNWLQGPPGNDKIIVPRM